MIARCCLLLGFTACLAGAAEPGAATPPVHPLSWDAPEKTLQVKPGDEAADFEFRATNRSGQAVEITGIRPSCGCTVAEMPSTPWILAPGTEGAFRGTIDFRGKHGRVEKTLLVLSAPGAQVLTIVVNVPDAPAADRAQNRALAAQDRQAVFRGDCARCHVAPAQGKRGAELFAAACGICHTPAHRAEMVPDLAVARGARDAEFWRKWIGEGKDGTLMPAFAQGHGGPLTDAQVESLVEFTLRTFPTGVPSR